MEKSGLKMDGMVALDKSYQNLLRKTNEIATKASNEWNDQVRKNREAFIQAVRLEIDSLQTRPF